MITCNKQYTIDVTGAGCFDDGTGPTPASLVQPGDGSMGIVTLPPPVITQGFPHEISYSGPFPVKSIMGRYTVNYIGGYLTIRIWNPPEPAGADGYYFNSLQTGTVSDTGGYSFGLIQVGGGPVAQMVGLSCIELEDDPSCDVGALVAGTLAMNPVSRWSFDVSFPWNFFLGSTDSSFPTTIITPPYDPVDIVAFFSTSDDFANSGSGVVNYQLVQLEKFDVPVKRCRIKDYVATVKPFWIQGGTCSTLRPAVDLDEWDGTFPVLIPLYPRSNQDNSVTYHPPEYTTTGQILDQPKFAINGFGMAQDLDYETAINYRSIAGVGYWELNIIMYLDGGYIQCIWYGRKTTGLTPVGEYTWHAANGPCLTDPASVCVEAF